MLIEGKDIKIKEYNNHFDKFKGLMFKKNIDYGLKLRCNGIHTFFMKEAIDVVLTDRENKVTHIYHNLKPNHIILPKKHVYYTYEFPANTIISLKVNEKIPN